MPPAFRGSYPNVGVRLRPRLAATIRFLRSMSSSAGVVPVALLLAEEDAGSPRSRRRASTYEARSPSIGLLAATGGGGPTGGGGGAIATAQTRTIRAESSRRRADCSGRSANHSSFTNLVLLMDDFAVD